MIMIVMILKFERYNTYKILSLHFYIILHYYRAEYYLEASQPADALNDCNTVLTLDNLCVQGYALRSKLSPSEEEEGEGEQYEEEDEGEDDEGEQDEGEGDEEEEEEGGDKMDSLERDILGLVDNINNLKVDSSDKVDKKTSKLTSSKGKSQSNKNESKSESESQSKAEKKAEKKSEKAEIKAQKRAEQLSSCATDALAAFLVGGSCDLMFASAAEESARESCRIGAREIFEERGRGRSRCEMERIGGGSSSGTSDSNSDNTVSHIRDTDVNNNLNGTIKEEPSKEVSFTETNQEEYLPRAWLVQSFFAGYDPLRTAFGMEKAEEDEEEFEEEVENGEKNNGVDVDLGKRVRELCVREYKLSGVSVSELNGVSVSSGDGNGNVGGVVDARTGVSTGVSTDIDEGTVNRNNLSENKILPDPPTHLLNPYTTATATDRLGYYMLRSLVCKLERTQEPSTVELSVVQAYEERNSNENYVEVLGSWMGEAERMWKELCAEEIIGDNIIYDNDEQLEEIESRNNDLDVEYSSMMNKLGLLGEEESDKNIGFTMGLKMGGRGSAQYAQQHGQYGQMSVQMPLTPYVPVTVLTLNTSDEFEEFVQKNIVDDCFLISRGNYNTTVSDQPSQVLRGTKTESQGQGQCQGEGQGQIDSLPQTEVAPPCSSFHWCLQLLQIPEVSKLTGCTFSPNGIVLTLDDLVPLSEHEMRGEEQREREEIEELLKNIPKPMEKGMEKGREKKDMFSFRGYDEDEDDEEEDEGEEGEEGDEDGEWEDCDDDDDEEEEEDEDNKENGDEKVEVDEVEKEVAKEVETAIDVSMNGIDHIQNNESESPESIPSTLPQPLPVSLPLPLSVSSLISTFIGDNNTNLSDSHSDSATATNTDTATAPVVVVEEVVGVAVEDISLPLPIAPPLASPLPLPISEPVHESLLMPMSMSVPVLTPVSVSVPLPVLTPLSQPLSRPLHARLLSVCSSIAYLSGDAIGAVKCLRASVREDQIAGTCVRTFTLLRMLCLRITSLIILPNVISFTSKIIAFFVIFSLE